MYPMIRYDIYINGILWRSVYDEAHILSVIEDCQEGDYEIKTIKL